MSNFKQTLNELYLAGYIKDKWAAKNMVIKYEKSSPEEKEALDKHALMVIEKYAPHSISYNDRIKSIKNNLQFIAWVHIVGIAAAFIVLLTQIS